MTIQADTTRRLTPAQRRADRAYWAARSLHYCNPDLDVKSSHFNALLSDAFQESGDTFGEVEWKRLRAIARRAYSACRAEDSACQAHCETMRQRAALGLN